MFRRVNPSFLLARADKLDTLFVPVLLMGVVIYFASRSDTFLSSRNLEQIAISGAGLAIAACGVTFAIVARELDLSMGSTAALSGVVAAKVMTETTSSVTAGVLAGIATGLAVGIVNGSITAFLRVPSFVTTLGTSVAAGGLALVFTGGSTISGVPAGFGDIANTDFLGLRTLTWIAVGVFIIAGVVLHTTGFGLRLFAVGDNVEAARLAGVRVQLVTMGALAISGGSAGLVGVVLASRVRAAPPGAHGDLALTAIAAVILGGTSIAGGAGSIAKTFWGVMLISVLKNGLDNIGLEFSYQNIVIGVVFILAASSEVIRTRMKAGTGGSEVDSTSEPVPATAKATPS